MQIKTSRFDFPATRAVTLLGAGGLLGAVALGQMAGAAAQQRVDAPSVSPVSSSASPAAAEQLTQFIDSTTHVVLYDSASDGALWARGLDWKARFGPESTTITPFLGSQAPRNFPVRFDSAVATLGGRPLDTRAASVRRVDDTVRIDRGAFVEEYALTPCSLEQRFVFPQLDGAGDLVVRMPIGSELTALDMGETLRFENDLGGLDYGQAYAIDADGALLALDSVLVEGVLELRVPAEFVARAAMPLVIDPLITAHSAANSGLHEVEPDVSYDVSTDRWCMVWSSIWSQTDYDVFARTATGSYALQPNLITIDFTTELWATPKIANNNFSNRFLVTCAVVAPSGLADIRGRLVDPLFGQASLPIPISPQDGVYRNWPDVGGDPHNSSASNYLVVWQKAITASNVDIEGRLVSHDGSLGPIVTLESSGEKHMLPAVSNSIGNDSPALDSVWTVAWLHEFNSQDHDIYAAQVFRNGVVAFPKFPVATSATDETSVGVSTLLDWSPQNLARNYVIVFDRDFGSDRDTVASVMEQNVVVSETNLVGAFSADTWFRDQRQAAIDSDGLHFVIGFSEYATKSSADGNVFVGDYFVDNTQLRICEMRVAIGGSPTDEQDLALHSMGSSGGPRQRFLGVYDYLSANNGYDIVGALYDGCESMVESVCASTAIGSTCPCGPAGAFGNGCANSANPDGGALALSGAANVSADTATFTVTNLPAGVSCLVFEGTLLTSPVPFGGGLRCANGVTTRLALKPTSVFGTCVYPEAGERAVSVAAGIPAFGGVRYYQAWYRDPGAVCVSKTNLTNALRVVWNP